MDWAKDDQDKAIWLHLREKETCRSCGTRRSEWDPDSGGDMHAYSPALGHCKGCAAVHQFREETKHQTAQIPGTYISLRRNTRG